MHPRVFVSGRGVCLLFTNLSIPHMKSQMVAPLGDKTGSFRVKKKSNP